jgi:glycosyltransferase involved in cell wall biosynthesis
MQEDKVMERQHLKNNPLISVIVPIYQVEEFLPRCIDSIINQTYTNLEIILVDDGSDDNCGAICDRYTANDSRIKVIHQSNQGLSEARNHGLDISAGEYIGFVDGDDCIHPEMYERLYRDICDYNTKLAFCQPNGFSEFNPVNVVPLERTECVSSRDLIETSLSKCIWWSACTKLYHRSLFESIRYPKGLINEDYPVTIRIYSKCTDIAVNYNGLYNYYRRNNSITKSVFSEKNFDQIETTCDVLQFIETNYPEFVDYAENIYISTIIKILNHLIIDKDCRWSHRCNDLFDLLDERFITSIRNSQIIGKHKIYLILAHCNRWAYCKCVSLYQKLR